VLPISTAQVDEVLELTDPRAMRALAHPVRLAILELLHEHGTANATECAREVGESPQACSYHLRALAKWGLVRNVESSDGRETRWEPAARAIRFSTAMQRTPGFAGAAAALKTTVLERDERITADFLAREHELPDEWRDAASLSSGLCHVTAEELKEITRRVHEVTKEFAARTTTDRPDGARRVDVIFRAIPEVSD
jgi:DNA-binding transcriptional ArsR family regulator